MNPYGELNTKQAAAFLRSLDDRESLGNNSLAIAFGGGHGSKRARAALAAVRLLIEAADPQPTSAFGDSAA